MKTGDKELPCPDHDIQKRKYEVWCEGYSATGNSGQAHLWGSIEASSFREACVALAAQKDDTEKYFNPTQLTWWGCSLFDNEADARKTFG